MYRVIECLDIFIIDRAKAAHHYNKKCRLRLNMCWGRRLPRGGKLVEY